MDMHNFILWLYEHIYMIVNKSPPIKELVQPTVALLWSILQNRLLRVGKGNIKKEINPKLF